MRNPSNSKPAATLKSRDHHSGRYATTQPFKGIQQPPSTAPVTLPALKFMEGEPLPKGTRVGHPFNIDPDVGMI